MKDGFENLRICAVSEVFHGFFPEFEPNLAAPVNMLHPVYSTGLELQFQAN